MLARHWARIRMEVGVPTILNLVNFDLVAGAAAVVLQQSEDGTEFADTDVAIENTATSAEVSGVKAGKAYFRLKVNGGDKNGYSNIATVTVS